MNKKFILPLALTTFSLLDCSVSKRSVTHKEFEDRLKTEETKVSSVSKEKETDTSNTKEKIITMYELRTDTIYKEGEVRIVNTPYPVKVIEEREIKVVQEIDRIAIVDSVRASVEKEQIKIEDKDIKTSNLPKGLSWLILGLTLASFVYSVYKFVQKVK